MVCVINSGGYYLELRPYNHRAGVSKLEVQGTGGSWTSLPRSDYNSFVYSSGPQLIFPLNVRITSRFGETVTFPVINAMTNGERFSANAQFNVFPDQGPSPVWMIPPVYADGTTTELGAQWSVTPYSGPSVNLLYPNSVYQGAYSLRITNFTGFSGVLFNTLVSFPRPTNGYLELAIRSEGASISALRVIIEGSTISGSNTVSSSIAFPVVDTTWRNYRIPLEPAQAPALINQVRLMSFTSSQLPNVLLDSISFRW
jgi:hypothetical protein